MKLNPDDFAKTDTRIGRKKEHTVRELIDAVNKYDLLCSPVMIRYMTTFPDEINGCGRDDERFPHTMYGLLIVWACYIHDAEWGISTTHADLEMANIKFRQNLDKIIDKDSANTLMKWIRGYRVRSYYNGVQYVGLPQELRNKGLDREEDV